MPSRQHFIKWFILSGKTLSFCLIYKYKCIHMRIYLCIARYYICMVTPTRSTPRYYYICVQLPWPDGHTITPTPGTSKQAIINSVSISWNLQNLGIQTKSPRLHSCHHPLLGTRTPSHQTSYYWSHSLPSPVAQVQPVHSKPRRAPHGRIIISGVLVLE